MRKQRFRLTGKVAVPLSSGDWELEWFRENAQRKLKLEEDSCLRVGVRWSLGYCDNRGEQTCWGQAVGTVVVCGQC